MADTISSETGDNADTSATGKGNQQASQRADPRQFLRSGDINFNNRDNEIIYAQLLRLVEESGKDRERTFAAIHALDMKVDDLPNKVNVLTGRVTNLEKVEVNVKPGLGEVTIKTVPSTDFNFPIRTVVLIMFLMLLAALVVMGWLIYRVNNG